ncbi:MFS transporter [Escherichia coli]
MDFQLYSLGAALVFHEIFFPESSTAMALILAMGTYGAGYVARIVGAFIFGKMGDRIGRKKVLFITITMMGICTTLIGVLPTYAQIGVFAPILLVTLRIIQGLGAGAEISGAGTMLAEYAPKGKRGIISSFVAMGTNCGTLSATAIWAFMFFILSKEELLAWGWRIPFLASVVVMVFAIWLRMNLKESPVFEKVNDSNQPTAKPAPAGSMFQSKSFFEQLTGVRDPAGVACEPFRQWVIEDNFVAGRPEWEKAGAELVSDVLPYEEMKLRMLNGSHSFLAYLGYLAGYQHINDCMEDEHYRHAAYALMLQEQAPTLKVQGVDLQDYANRLIERYSNPALRHRTWQIAMDGSQKLPQRMLDSVRWHLAHDSKFDLLALGVAGWMRYVGGVDEQGNPIEISDPLLPVIQKAVQSSAEGKARVQSLLAIKAIFGDDLPDNSLFTAKVTEAYLSLLAHGAKATVAKYSVK